MYYAIGITIISQLFVGCNRSSTRANTVAASKRREHIKERSFSFTIGEPEFIDPNMIAESEGSRIATQLFEGLLNVAADGIEIVPGVARSWSTSPDGKTVTFVLREDACWSDGTRITAEDFIYSWKRALSPETQSPAVQNFWPILGAKAFSKGDRRSFSSVGVHATSPYVLMVELENPTPFFTTLVSSATFAPIPRHRVEKHGSKWTRPEHIVSNGPFKLTHWRHREYIKMSKNPRYWNKDNVWIEKIVAYHSEDKRMSFRWYENGKVDWLPHGNISADQANILIQQNRADLVIDPLLCVYNYIFNMNRPPFDDVNVRRAFNMALDKGKIVRQVTGTNQRPAGTFVPTYMTDAGLHPGVRGEAFDPGKAKELLAASRYGEHASSQTMPKIELIYNTDEMHRRIAEFAQQSWQTYLGVEVTISNMEWKSMLKKVRTKDFQLVRSGWCADYPDPINFLDVFESDSSLNRSGFVSKVYDQLLERIRSEPDTAKRLSVLGEAELVLLRDTPVVPVYFYTQAYMVKSYVQGFARQFQDNRLFKYIRYASDFKTQLEIKKSDHNLKGLVRVQGAK